MFDMPENQTKPNQNQPAAHHFSCTRCIHSLVHSYMLKKAILACFPAFINMICLYLNPSYGCSE